MYSQNLIHEQMSNNTNVRTLIELLTKEARVKDLTKETSKLNITQRGYTYLSFSWLPIIPGPVRL